MTQDPAAIRHQIQRHLQTRVDPDYPARIRQSVPTSRTIVGVRVPAVRSLTNGMKKAHPDITAVQLFRLLDDLSPDVRKAVGWALREATKNDPGAVYQFLAAHKSETQPTVRRQSVPKLPPAPQSALMDAG